jgi:hypothetical protein
MHKILLGCKAIEFDHTDQVIAVRRQYDIKVKTEGVNTSKLFTGSFTHNEKKLRSAISIPLKLSYRLEGKTVILYNYGVQ